MTDDTPTARATLSDPKLLARVIGLCVLAYLAMLSYALARPSCESLFLEAHGTEALPRVWILVALGAAATVAIYNRFSLRHDLVMLYGAVAAISSALLAALIFAWKAELPYVGYALYVWKDLYVVVLVEIFYSFANVVFPIQRARWFYGLFGVFGSLGGISGNLAIGGLAASFGTVDSLWSILPVLGTSFLVCVVFARLAGHRSPMAERGAAPPKWSESFKVVGRSRYLLLMLALVAVVQVVITLIDYQYNGLVEAAYPDTDARTAVIGKIYAAVNTGTIVAHALVGPIFRALAIPATLLSIPALLGVAVLGFAIHPRFAAVAVAKVASKVFDYTIFRAGKEMLYIPLGYAEKTAGKAVVDMLTYRVAKGGASLILLGLGALATQALISGLNLALIAIWLGLTAAIVVRFRRRVSRDDELRGP